MTVIYNMSIDRADKPWIGDRRFTEYTKERAGGMSLAVTGCDAGGAVVAVAHPALEHSRPHRVPPPAVYCSLVAFTGAQPPAGH